MASRMGGQGENHDAGCVPIKPMHEQRIREGVLQARHQAIGQLRSFARYRKQTRGFVHHQQFGIHMQDVEWGVWRSIGGTDRHHVWLGRSNETRKQRASVQRSPGLDPGPHKSAWRPRVKPGAAYVLHFYPLTFGVIKRLERGLGPHPNTGDVDFIGGRQHIARTFTRTRHVAHSNSGA